MTALLLLALALAPAEDLVCRGIPTNPRFSTVTATTGKFDFLDAGTGMVNGDLQVLGTNRSFITTCAGTGCVAITGGGSMTIAGGGVKTGASGSTVISCGHSTGDNCAIGSALGAAAATSANPAFVLHHNNGALGANDGLLALRDNSVDKFNVDAEGDVQMAASATLTAGSAGSFILGASTSSFRVVNVTDSAVAPTVTACAGGTAATMTWSNGTASFRFDVGTACTGESTAVLTLPTTTNAWTCFCWNVAAPTHNIHQSGYSTTGATMTNYAATLATVTDWVDGADIQCSCRGG